MASQQANESHSSKPSIIDPDMTNSEEPPSNKKQAAVMEWLLGKLETSLKIPFLFGNFCRLFQVL